MVRTFQEHQNAMIKSLRDHVESLSNSNAKKQDEIIVLTEALRNIEKAAENPEITDLAVLRMIIKNEVNNYLDWSKRQD